MVQSQETRIDETNKAEKTVPHIAGNESTLNTVITFSTAIPGDINDDQRVDLLDAILALRLASGLPVNASVAITRDADVNGDGKIGPQEIVYILQRVAGMRE